MKFKIVYDNNINTIRVRAGKAAFTKNEGFGLTSLLLSKENIQAVKVSSVNGSIKIKYSGSKKRVLKSLINIKKSDLFEVEPTIDDNNSEINSKYIRKIIKKIGFIYIIKYLLPVGLNKIIILFRVVPYLIKGFSSLVHLKIDVKLLDATSILFTLSQNMFEETHSILLLLNLTDLLEEYVKEKSKYSLEHSLMLNINKVWIKTKTGEEVQIPYTQLKKGDSVVIRTNEVIPVDGTIITGNAQIDESIMTGISTPIDKDEGKAVFAGTKVEKGSIVIDVKEFNENTRINQIVELIEKSDTQKANIQSQMETIVDSVIPWNFAITGFTYLTGNTTKAITALTVDYSSAIQVAIPVSIITAMRETSERKIIVKGGKYLETFANADTIIFDKRGTLTKSEPRIVKSISLGVLSDDEVLRQAACIEEHFPHSVANAIVESAFKKGLKHGEELHSEVEYISSHGIVTTLVGKRTILGSKHFVIEEEKVEITPEKQKIIDDNVEDYSIIYLAIDGKLEGIICIDDPIRKESKEVLKTLKQLGIENIIMVTGDSENAAHATAEYLGIEQYKSQLLPIDKANIVEETKAKGNKVIMVGEGINDSPALSAADVGVAMKDSSNFAQEVADITLLRPTLYDLITLRIISQKMLKLIDRNYNLNVLLNTTYMALGLLGFLTPTLTSFLHNGTIILLGLYSYRTKNFKDNKYPIIE